MSVVCARARPEKLTEDIIAAAKSHLPEYIVEVRALENVLLAVALMKSA